MNTRFMRCDREERKAPNFLALLGVISLMLGGARVYGVFCVVAVFLFFACYRLLRVTQNCSNAPRLLSVFP